MKRLRKQATRLAFLLAYLHLSMFPGLAQSTITTYAGGVVPVDGTPAFTQNIDSPRAVVSDGAGGFYFASAGTLQNKVYRVSANGTLTSVAGSGAPGFNGDGGPATSALLSSPSGLALDGSGNLFIADASNNRVRKVTPAGVISTVAGSGLGGFVGDGGPGVSARISNPSGVTVDGSGNLFIADSGNRRVRKVTPDGVISTVAGNGTFGFSGDGGPAASAQIRNPRSVAVDLAGNLFIADSNSFRVRKVTPDGIISTVAGNGTTGMGGDGGPAVSAPLSSPNGIAVDGSGNLFIADTSNQRIRKVTPAGVISTVAGTGTAGFSGDGGFATSAQLSGPIAVAVDGSGSLFIADSSNYRVRKVTSDGVIGTVAGNGTTGFSGDGGFATFAQLSSPTGVAVDAAGNVFIADTNNSRIRKVNPIGIMDTFAGNGAPGSIGDGGPAASAQLDHPTAVAVDPPGNVFVADCSKSIRKIGTDTIISAFAANAWNFCNFYYFYYYGSGAPPSGGVAADASGNLFVADSSRHRINKVTPDGAISIVAGTGTAGFSGDGGPAAAARLNSPWGIAVDAAGNIFVADSGNARLRKITPDGNIATVAGTGTHGFSGDAGPATSAMLYPSGVAVDKAGNIFVADPDHARVRKVTSTGIISTVAGNGTYGYSGDGGLATSAQLTSPSGVAVDAAGNLFIADKDSNRIRKVTFALAVPTLTGISPAFGVQDTTVNITLTGTSFAAPLTIDAGSGITVSNVSVLADVLATATLTIASNATPGARNLTVTTSLGTNGAVPFLVSAPFSDLSISSSHTGNLEAGFNGTYTVGITNLGPVATTGPVIVTDTLPLGLSFVSGIGSGWSCSASGQTVTCVKADSLAAGASTTLALTVAVDSSAPARVVHAPTVTAAGDLMISNNTASDATTVTLLAPRLQFVPASLAAGQQATVGVTLPTAFSNAVTGTITMGFSSEANIPADDPAIQFATGGREVAFTIPANTLTARFAVNPQAGSLGFQPGTVAGTLTFTVTLQADNAKTTVSSTLRILRQAPAIQAMHTETGNGFAVVMTLLSTVREVTDLTLRFDTKPAVVLSCGTATGCSVSGSSLTFNVKSLFDAWFVGHAEFGGLSSLRLPFSIQGTVQGTVSVTFRNSVGSSISRSFTLP